MNLRTFKKLFFTLFSLIYFEFLPHLKTIHQKMYLSKQKRQNRTTEKLMSTKGQFSSFSISTKNTCQTPKKKTVFLN